MSKVYSVCLVALLCSAVTVMPSQNTDTLLYYAGCIMAGLACYTVTIFQDEKNINKPSWKYRMSASATASFMAFHLYPSVKDLNVNLLITSFHPFPTIHIFIGTCSYFAISIFREAKSISNFGWRKYIGQIGDKLKAISKEKK